MVRRAGRHCHHRRRQADDDGGSGWSLRPVFVLTIYELWTPRRRRWLTILRWRLASSAGRKPIRLLWHLLS